MVLSREKEQGILPETAQKDIGEFLFRVCGYLLEEDMELYEEVSAEMEPAIKLSREIIQELRDDIGTLQENISILHQERENGYKNLVSRQKKKGSSMAETEDALMEVFSLTKEEAAEKVRLYFRE